MAMRQAGPGRRRAKERVRRHVRWVVPLVLAVVLGHDGLMAANVHAAVDEGGAATAAALGRHPGLIGRPGPDANHSLGRLRHSSAHWLGAARGGALVPAPARMDHFLGPSQPTEPDCAVVRSAAQPVRTGLGADGDIAVDPPLPPPAVLTAAAADGPGPTASPAVRRAMLQVYRI